MALTVPDFDHAVGFYRDALGLEQVADWHSEQGRVVLLTAGRATIELMWGDRNARILAPDGMQLRLFTSP